MDYLRIKKTLLGAFLGEQYMPQITDNAYFGLYKPTEKSTTSITVPHELGKIPQFAVIFDCTGELITATVGGLLVEFTKEGTQSAILVRSGSRGNAQAAVSASATENDITFPAGRYYDASYQVGRTYQYIVW